MALSVDNASPTHINKVPSSFATADDFTFVQNHTASPTQINKESIVSVDFSPLLGSPSSEKHFWSALRSRVDTILEDRNRKFQIKPLPLGVGELECGKRFREDSLLLLRGFDSVAASLSQLTSNLDTCLQGASDLAKPSLSELLHREPKRPEDEEIQPRAKRQCSTREPSDNLEVVQKIEKKESPVVGHVEKSEKLKKAKNLAISMATKAASLTRELKSIKSDLCFMQERCALLEEENRRLRDGFPKGVRAEEDDLVRLQLEALLGEKSRLANENANLTRENQCLHQLVEYHQLTSQDLSASYEHAAIRGMCLDFSSPSMEKGIEYDEDDNDEADDGIRRDIQAPQTPRTDVIGFSSLDEH